MNPDYNIIGRLNRAHGIKGAFRAESFTSPPEAILNYQNLYLLKGKQEPFAVKVKNAKAQMKTGLIIKFLHINTRTEAENLAGCYLAVKREDLPPLAADEFYWADLIGLNVQDDNGEILGLVKNIFEAGASPLLVVKNESLQKELLLPFHKETILDINLEKKIISLTLPSGLIDLQK